ncbi:toll-like receptor 6 [Drosophila takahashii]|uniref:toll-like receptor 6 n=1 Tax=Drosophila takahashii TaxID=29030 RepID=UPI001CF8DBB2|nr:toll-like receptor 7 [Drosophila takahashii]
MYLSYLLLLLSVHAFVSPDIIQGNTNYSEMLELHMESCLDLKKLNHMPNLHTLKLDYCDIETFSMDYLVPVPQLTALEIRRGNLLLLHDKHFARWPNMKILQLGGNFITKVTNESFKGIPQLWLLALPGNGIEFLPQGVFHDLPELLHLDLSGNKIMNLQENTFAGNRKLQMLLLNRNPLTRIPPTVLGSLRNLLLLDLNNAGPLQNLTLPSAHTIILDKIGLKYLDIKGSVIKLQARSNQLINIKFADKSSIIELDLNNNSLTTSDIQGVLKGMWRLQGLDLSENLIDNFTAASVNSSELLLLPNLMYLNLSGNLLEHLHNNSLLPWTRLTHLDLAYNRMKNLPEFGIQDVFNLRSLNLVGNLFNNDSEIKKRAREVYTILRVAGVQIMINMKIFDDDTLDSASPWTLLFCIFFFISFLANLFFVGQLCYNRDRQIVPVATTMETIAMNQVDPDDEFFD